jgi:hypothetical protein
MFLTGCGISSESLRLNNQKNLMNVSIGMNKKEVMDIMGYQSAKPKFRGAFQHQLPAANNPYKSEIIKIDSKTYEVLYYLTDNKKDDGAITDDELTPMYFNEGILMGWGLKFLDEEINKYEFRIR